MIRCVACTGLMLLGSLWAATSPAAHLVRAAATVGAAGVDTTQLPTRLVDTGLYADRRIGPIAEDARPFSPQYPLWSDGMTKRRWILLPAGSTIDATDEQAWAFPVGTRLWKEFSLEGRPVETRMFWRVSATRWVSGAYVWNDEGTDAVLAPAEGIPGHVEVGEGRRHGIPAQADCAACHGPEERVRVLGFNALQLSTDRDPAALHGEPLRPGMVTLETLETEGRLTPARPGRLTSPPRIATANAPTRAMLGYLAANCGMCHDGRGEIAGFNASLAYRDMVADGDAVVASLLEQPSRWQVPGLPAGDSVLLRAGKPAESAMFVRMRSRSPSSQMPPLGSVLRDTEALDEMERWITVTLARPR